MVTHTYIINSESDEKKSFDFFLCVTSNLYNSNLIMGKMRRYVINRSVHEANADIQQSACDHFELQSIFVTIGRVRESACDLWDRFAYRNI